MELENCTEIPKGKFTNYLTKTLLYNWNFRGSEQFPCPLPVSLERKNIEKIHKFEYLIGVKNDGVRYAMMFVKDVYKNNKCILVNRNLNFYQLEFNCDDNMYHNTMLDGELVNENGKYKFIVYDAVCLCGNRINKKFFMERLAEIDYCIRTLASEPYQNSIKIEPKTFYKMSQFDDFIKYYESHENKDGVILMPNKLPVLNGTQFSMFKWKPINKHTMDFQIKKEDENLGVYVYHQKELIKYAIVKSDNESGQKFISKFNSLHNTSDDCILECLYSDESKSFNPLLVRNDKNYPNSLRTVERTLFNAKENIKLIELVA